MPYKLVHPDGSYHIPPDDEYRHAVIVSYRKEHNGPIFYDIVMWSKYYEHASEVMTNLERLRKSSSVRKRQELYTQCNIDSHYEIILVDIRFVLHKDENFIEA